MTTFKGKVVPEGATHWSDKHPIDQFYKYHDGHHFSVYQVAKGRWMPLLVSWALDYDLVELPSTKKTHSKDEFIEKCSDIYMDMSDHDKFQGLIATLYDNGARFVSDKEPSEYD